MTKKNIVCKGAVINYVTQVIARALAETLLKAIILCTLYFSTGEELNEYVQQTNEGTLDRFRKMMKSSTSKVCVISWSRRKVMEEKMLGEGGKTTISLVSFLMYIINFFKVLR